MIGLKNVGKCYQTKAGFTYVLRQINLEIEAGEFVTIMGPSAAGKSTLLNILGMLDHDYEGEYYLDGQAVHTLKPKDRQTLNRQSEACLGRRADRQSALHARRGHHGLVPETQPRGHHDHPSHAQRYVRRLWQTDHPPQRRVDGERTMGAHRPNVVRSNRRPRLS